MGNVTGSAVDRASAGSKKALERIFRARRPDGGFLVYSRSKGGSSLWLLLDPESR